MNKLNVIKDSQLPSNSISHEILKLAAVIAAACLAGIVNEIIKNVGGSNDSSNSIFKG